MTGELGRAWIATYLNLIVARLGDRGPAYGAPGVEVDDCRLENEAATVRGLGGAVIEITRAGPKRTTGYFSKPGVVDDIRLATARPARWRIGSWSSARRCGAQRDNLWGL